MILVDTSVWIDHLRSGDPQLTALLVNDSVLAHAFVIGELALGTLRQPEVVIASLHGLPKAVKADDSEVLQMIQKRQLSGLGIGYVDAHLLASALLTENASLWTRDRRLQEMATRLSLAAPMR
jgi:predicted nucleic acid-binding protein